jgi:hypothetical protein
MGAHPARSALHENALEVAAGIPSFSHALLTDQSALQLVLDARQDEVDADGRDNERHNTRGDVDAGRAEQTIDRDRQPQGGRDQPRA